MFDNPDFYPTPDWVIEKMLNPHYEDHEKWYGFSSKKVRAIKEGITILEPSAGSGNIVKYILDQNVRDVEVYAIEPDPELREILKSKDCSVIGENFFEFKGGIYFDLIIMNPPFSNGDKHLLHAWNLLDEGHIVCLLNQETIKNPYSESRKHLVSLIEKHGSVEFLGDCFSDAKRKTNVEVALVRMKKTSTKSKFDFDFEKVTSEKGFQIDEETFSNQLATRDVVENMMIQFENMKNFYTEYLKARKALKFYSEGITSKHFDVLEVADKTISESKSPRDSFNKFSSKVRSQMWRLVIEQSKIQKYMTSNVQKNFEGFITQQGKMDFNHENVARMIEFIFENRFTILEQAVTDVFNKFTEHHAENRYMVEGWKTNGRYKVNRRVIIPYAITYGQYLNAHQLKEWGDKFSVSYTKYSVYSDIDRVMCYLTGRNMDKICGIEESLNNHFRLLGKIKTGDKFESELTSEFFDLKFYKKGTLHLYFKDERLWDEFNMRACLKKNWLPAEEAHEYEARKRKEAKANQPVREEPKPQLLLENVQQECLLL